MDCLAERKRSPDPTGAAGPGSRPGPSHHRSLSIHVKVLGSTIGLLELMRQGSATEGRYDYRVVLSIPFEPARTVGLIRDQDAELPIWTLVKRAVDLVEASPSTP